jgi:hypothetical protein
MTLLMISKVEKEERCSVHARAHTHTRTRKVVFHFLFVLIFWSSSMQTMGSRSQLMNQERMVSLIMCTAIKIADLSHTFAEFSTHRRWSELLEEELFLQGDVERSMGRYDHFTDL